MSDTRALEKLTYRSEPPRVSFSKIIAALSYALDLTEGACPGHAVRTCILGMQIGRELGLSDALLSDCYYALLLKDAGCSSNAARLYQVVGDDEIRAKRLTKVVDWTRFEWKQMHYLLKHAHAQKSPLRRIKGVHSMVRESSRNAEMLIRLRCNEGARVARDLGLGPATAGAVYYLDEHWDGQGYPDRLSGEDIPILARLANLAQTLEVFHRLYGPVAAIDVVKARSGRWFDPTMVRAVVSLQRQGTLWSGLATDRETTVADMEPHPQDLLIDTFSIDNICVAFGGVVDAKSHYTYTHSTGVTRAAVHIAQSFQLSSRDTTTLRRAALLHDIGKLSVPNSILDKPGALTEDEWGCIKQHPHYTFEILNRVPGFEQIARIAAAHHEKLDGKGYHRGIQAEEICPLSRILAVADMFDALSGARPYRGRLSPDQVMGILRKESPNSIDERCVAALENFVEQAQVVA